MSQNDFTLANQGFPSMRADMNSALQALASSSSSATEPSTTYANQFWYDTTTSVLKLRNEANSAWLPFWNQDVTTTASPTFAGLTTPSISATGGTIENVEIGSSVPAKGTFTTLVSNNVSATGALSNRNVIVNGGMQVDQRNGGAAVTVSSDVATYIVDRMSSYNSTASGTITAQQSTVGNQSSAKMTATSPITDLSGTKRLHGPTTLIEGFDCYHLNGSDITISFTVETNWTGNLGINLLKMPSVAKSYVVDVPVTSGINNVSVTVTLEADTVPTNDNAIGLYLFIGSQTEGTLVTATTGSWVSGDYRATPSTTAWAKTTGNFINLTNLQLEAGDQSTPFEHRSYGDELARCQRYYEKSYPHGVSAGTAAASPFQSSGVQGAVSTGEISGGSVLFSVAKRSSPTMAMYDLAGTVAKATRIELGVANNNNQAAVFQDSTTKGFRAYSSSGASASAITFHWTADAEL